MKKYNYPPHIPIKEQLYSMFFLNDAIKVIGRQFKLNGDTYSLKSRFISYRIVFTKDPDLIRYFLQKNHKNYEKSIYQTEKLAKFLGKGLLTNSGDDWRKQRRLIQPGFSHKKIESLNGLVLKEIERFIATIPKNETIDFYPYFHQLAFNVVAKSLFSSDISQNDIDTISRVLTKSQEFYIQETIHPIVELYMQKTGKTKRMIHKIEKVREIFQRLIDIRKTEDSKDDLLDMMLNVKYEDTGETMTDEQLIDELLILFIAGHETTANALSFTFYLLGKHPEYIQKLKQEIDTLGDEKYSLETIFSPSIAQNVLKESMRLYPLAWSMDRQALTDDSFGNFSWEKDTILIASAYAMNRDEKNWDNPSNFKPERFFEKDTKKKMFIPFGSGPRYCIGEHFAMMEMVLVLRHFFSNYNFQLERKEIKLKPMVTLRPDQVLGKMTEL